MILSDKDCIYTSYWNIGLLKFTTKTAIENMNSYWKQAAVHELVHETMLPSAELAIEIPEHGLLGALRRAHSARQFPTRPAHPRRAKQRKFLCPVHASTQYHQPTDLS